MTILDSARGGWETHTLPARPSLEHLKHAAKRRLSAIRAARPDTKLTDVQFRIAREYGFSSWRDLKSEVDRRSREGRASGRFERQVGFFRHDPSVASNSVLMVTEDRGRLFVQQTGSPRFELLRQSDDVFAPPGLGDRYVFEGPPGEPGAVLIIHRDNASTRLDRTDAAAARRAESAFATKLAEQARPRAATAVSQEQLNRYPGHYSPQSGPVIEVTRVGDQMFAQVTAGPRHEIFPETKTRFFYRIQATQLTFVEDAGRVIGLILHQGGRDHLIPRVSAKQARLAGAANLCRLKDQTRARNRVDIDPALLAGYVDRYHANVARGLTVTTRDGRLFVQGAREGQPPVEVFPESERKFFWTDAPVQITFITDGAGRANHVVLHQGGRETLLARAEWDDEPSWEKTP
jgi:hypothetical protein